MEFTPSTPNDIEQLSEWIQVDPYHRDCLNPHWWLTGNGLLSFCVSDEHGPLAFIRLDKEDDRVRLHTQFGPREVVSRERLIDGMFKAIPIIIGFAKKHGSAIIYNSTNSSLIRFMNRNFQFVPAQNDDYVLVFEV